MHSRNLCRFALHLGDLSSQARHRGSGEGPERAKLRQIQVGATKVSWALVDGVL